jgi:hypothetical protein
LGQHLGQHSTDFVGAEDGEEKQTQNSAEAAEAQGAEKGQDDGDCRQAVPGAIIKTSTSFRRGELAATLACFKDVRVSSNCDRCAETPKASLSASFGQMFSI